MSNLTTNTTQLEALLAKVNALPEAGGSEIYRPYKITFIAEGIEDVKPTFCWSEDGRVVYIATYANTMALYNCIWEITPKAHTSYIIVTDSYTGDGVLISNITSDLVVKASWVFNGTTDY
jgi:hypothetical protein